jgi:hypothetical protein
MIHRYAHCGLHVVSELELPELAGASAGDLGAGPTVRIAVARAPDLAELAPSFVVKERECRFDMRRTGSFMVRGGREITVAPLAGAEAATVRLFLLGSAWGALIHQRGEIPLHGGVTAVDGIAYAFCGPHAAGKSSIVASLLSDAGHELVGDDLTRVVSSTGAVDVWPSLPRLKLAPASLEQLGWSVEDHLPDSKLGKRLVWWSGAQARSSLPLGALIVLAWGEPGLKRLTGVAAVTGFLAAATYRPQLHDSPEALHSVWRQTAELVGCVPVYKLTRPRTWSGHEAALERIDHLISSSSM